MFSFFSSLFGGITAKIAAFFAALSAVFLLFIKWQSSTIKKQKQKIKGFTKKQEMREEMETAKKEVLAKEKQKIKGAKSDDKEITLDDINNL